MEVKKDFEDVPLKEHDFVPSARKPHDPPHEFDHTRDHPHSDSDSTATNSSDFNWDEDEEAAKEDEVKKTKAKRGRAIYLALMRLSRPFRVFLLGFLGTALFIAPLLIVQFLFKHTSVYPHVFVWSLWVSIIWVAGCLTYLVVDAVPRAVISLVILFGGHVERLKIQLEVRGNTPTMDLIF